MFACDRTANFWKAVSGNLCLLWALPCSSSGFSLQFSRSPSLLSEVVRWDQNVDPCHMLGLKGAVGVLRHVHIHADLLRPAQLLHQYQLASLSVWALHDEDASGVSARYAEAQTVWPGAARGGSGRHAEKRGRGLQVGRQGQVVEGYGLGSQVAGAAVHGTGVSLTLTAGQKGSMYDTESNIVQGDTYFDTYRSSSSQKINWISYVH